MKILNIRVVAKASSSRVKDEGGRLKVYVTSPAQDGMANAKVIELLAEYLGVKKYELRIVKGLKSKDKTVEVNV
ncbi:MAG: DUF167 domain-containing protein [Candidatus Omnitrophica bacterium]|nr:DUF167 domain-containing protein [Candidatus Omnitrophota bacterium]